MGRSVGAGPRLAIQSGANGAVIVERRSPPLTPGGRGLVLVCTTRAPEETPSRPFLGRRPS